MSLTCLVQLWPEAGYGPVGFICPRRTGGWHNMAAYVVSARYTTSSMLAVAMSPPSHNDQCRA